MVKLTSKCARVTTSFIVSLPRAEIINPVLRGGSIPLGTLETGHFNFTLIEKLRHDLCRSPSQINEHQNWSILRGSFVVVWTGVACSLTTNREEAKISCGSGISVHRQCCNNRLNCFQFQCLSGAVSQDALLVLS